MHGGQERVQMQGTRGVGKNVARTGDITGSNVTRSRRASSPLAEQGRQGFIKRDTLHSREGERTRDTALVLRLLTITIDLPLFLWPNGIQIYLNQPARYEASYLALYPR